MNAQVLLDCIGQIDDSLLLQAENFCVKRQLRLKWILPTAACLALAMSALFLFLQPQDYSELPKLEINMDSGGMGFEGLMAYRIEDLENGNPWTEQSRLKTLPVFQNTRVYNRDGFFTGGLSTEEMKDRVRDAAEKLGLKIDSIQVRSISEIPEAAPYRAFALCGDTQVEVSENGGILISYPNGKPLPKEYSFTLSHTTQEQAEASLHYLLQQYHSLTGLHSPALDIAGSYSIDAAFCRSYGSYEGTGSPEQQIVAYHFTGISFVPNENGELSSVSLRRENLSQKLGDYPIITAKQARELLLQGHYISSVPEGLPEHTAIARTELVYHVSGFDTVFMPYYRMLIELPDRKQENGLKTFGVFYVPAVRSDFLEALPLWDGQIN